MRISDWSSDVCSSDLILLKPARELFVLRGPDLVGRFHAHPVQQRGEVVAGLLRRIFLRGDVAEHLKEEVPGLVQEGRAVRVLEQADRHAAVGQDADLAARSFGSRLLEQPADSADDAVEQSARSEEHTTEHPSLMRRSYAVFCLKKKIKQRHRQDT